MVNPKCKSCDRYISVIELKSSGEPYKSCNKCRDIQKNIYIKKNNKEYEPDNNKVLNNIPVWTNDIKENNIYKGDIEINTDNKKTNKCIICKELWVRADTEKVWESIECLTCYKCRANGGNPDNIDISHEIYPEPVKNKIPVWTPDSSESD